MKTNHKTLYIALGTLALGLLLGWLFFGGNDTAKIGAREEISEAHVHKANEVWTCSMHPQIREDGSGQCPICGMDLILVSTTETETVGEGQIQMTQTAMQIANVQTVIVERAEPTKEIYLSGKVVADERNVGEITARFGGRIEKLYVNFTGQQVKRGQALASVYSPELVTAQKELFEAAKFRESNPSFYEAAVNKLKLWDLSDRQIENILESQEVRYNFNVLAPQSGTVVARNVSDGDYVQEGQSLFEVANLSQLWVVFDAYESDLPWIREGDEIRFTVESLPGQTFTSQVTFIDPVISPQRRVAEVRTEVKNDQQKLKPQMFAQGVLQSELPGVENALVIPKTAVLWTGKRAVVYVKQPGIEAPTFAYREVLLGPEAGGQYIVSEGLEEGEEVVANGVFKIDAAAQLQGKASMMNPNGGRVSTGHDHGEMEMSEVETVTTEGTPSSDLSEVNSEFRQQLAEVLDPYLALKNALVASEAGQAAAAARQTQQALEKVDMTLVKGEAHQQWMDYLNTMQKALGTIAEEATLETQRAAFASLSEALYQSVQQFDVTGLRAYYQYCPMADNNTGAYWLSEEKEIRNPYFGDQMLTCGSVKETIN
ncbi:MAG: efflux RND transporter periplasmic adaptor subunit [Tunicatimonas sp.]